MENVTMSADGFELLSKSLYKVSDSVILGCRMESFDKFSYCVLDVLVKKN